MDIYRGSFPKYKKEKQGNTEKTLYYTEIGVFTKTAMVKRMLELGPEGYIKAFNAWIIDQKLAPQPYEVFHYMFCAEYFPKILSEEFSKEEKERYGNLVMTKIEIFVLRTFLEKEQKTRNSRAGKVLYAFQNCILKAFSESMYLKADDGHFYHLFDARNIGDDEDRLDMVDKLVFNVGRNTLIAAIGGINKCFEYRDEISNPMDMIEIINWYIRVAKLFRYQETAKMLAETLKHWSGVNTETRNIAMAVFEDNQANLEKVYRYYPELDFVDRGRYTEYESIEDFAEDAGIDIEKLFAESACTERDKVKPLGSSGSTAKKKDPNYGVRILNDIRDLNKLMKSQSQSIKILNIKPNEVKKRKAQVFGQYIAIAIKIDNEWWILVDSIKPENAIYLWHGEKYLEGLEIFKSSKTYALEQENVERRYHRSAKPTFDIYKDVLGKHGIAV